MSFIQPTSMGSWSSRRSSQFRSFLRCRRRTCPEIQQHQGNAELTVFAYSQDGKIQLDQGKLTLVDNEILQTTGSIRLKAEFPNKAHRLWPGELISVRLLVDTRHDGLTVPASVVQQGQQGAYAYVVDPDGSVTISSNQGFPDQSGPSAH